MIRHVVMFRFNQGASDSAKEEMAAGLASLRSRVPVIRGWSQGANVVPSDRSYDFCLVGDFESEADLQTYQDHPAHQDVITRLIRPIVSSVVVVDFPLS